MNELFGFLTIFVLVLINGFFVAAEFALVSVRRTRIDQLANEGSKRGRLTQKVLKDLDLYIAATQLGITMASLGIGFLAEPAIEHTVRPTLLGWNVAETSVTTISFIIAFTLSTALHIVFGELAPKSLALQRSEQVSLAVSIPMIVFATVFRPFIYVLNATGNGVVRLLGLRPVTGHHTAHSEEEIRMIVSASRQEGVLEEQEKELLNNVFDLSDTPVRGIMTPRVDMIAIEENAPLRRLMQLNEEHGYSRVPIYRDTTDNIIGVAYIGDILRHLDHLDTVSVGQIARPTVFAPENMKVLDLFPLLQRAKTHMAIVVDEFGSAIGILSMEDIFEEVVGTVDSGFDFDTMKTRRVTIESEGDDTHLISGRAPISELNDSLKLNLPVGEAHTLAGFLINRLRHIPEVGDTVLEQGYRYTVTEADARAVTKVRVERV